VPGPKSAARDPRPPGPLATPLVQYKK